ncbi:hypothetical protein D3C87_1527300 [compost metagenome]
MQLQLQRLRFIFRLDVYSGQSFQIRFALLNAVSSINKLRNPAAVFQLDLISRLPEITRSILRIFLRQRIQRNLLIFGNRIGTERTAFLKRNNTVQIPLGL